MPFFLDIKEFKKTSLQRHGFLWKHTSVIGSIQMMALNSVEVAISWVNGSLQKYITNKVHSDNMSSDQVDQVEK